MDYDLVFIHSPSYYDFRKRPWFPGNLAGTVHFTPVFEGIPIGLISMAEYVERFGHKVRIFNIAEFMMIDEKFDAERFIQKIESRYFGIDLHFCVHSQGAIEIARMCKLYHDDSKVIMGGLTASIFAKEIIRDYPFVDYVIQGEAEEPLLQLLNGRSLNKIPNMIYRNQSGVVKESGRYWRAENLDSYEFTRLDLITPRRLLININTEFGNVNHWMIPVCRGCLYNCATCGGSKYAYFKICHRENPIFRSKEKIIEDFQKLSRQGIDSVFLFMDARMGGKSYWESLFESLAKRDHNIKFITLELFQPASNDFMSQVIKLNNSVKIGLSISPESGNEEVRKAHGRLYDNNSLLKTANVCCNNDINLGIFFMFGLAKETEATLRSTYELCKKFMEINLSSRYKNKNLIIPQFGEMIILDPGSLAFDYPEKYGYRLYFKNLRDHIIAMSSPAWTDWLSYETEYLNRRQLLEIPIKFYRKLLKYYRDINLIDNNRADIFYRKNKIDEIIMNELENIRLIKNVKRREKRYLKLSKALVDYDKGMISLTWKIRKKLGVLDYI